MYDQRISKVNGVRKVMAHGQHRKMHHSVEDSRQYQDCKMRSTFSKNFHVAAGYQQFLSRR